MKKLIDAIIAGCIVTVCLPMLPLIIGGTIRNAYDAGLCFISGLIFWALILLAFWL